MKFSIILLIFIVLILCSTTKENFYGMNYIQQHEYLRCCNTFGCSHPECQRFLHYNMSNMRLIGVVYQNNSFKGKVHKLYSRKNRNSNEDEYFLKVHNYDGDYFYKKLNIRYIHSGDKITIDNNSFIVSLYENLYDRDHYFDKFYTRNFYSGHSPRRFGRRFRYPSNFMKHGYLVGNKKNDFTFLYKKNIGRNRWKYYMKKANALIPLDKYQNKYINDNDVIQLPINNKKYKFKQFDN